ncbi:MAG: TIGR04222 domain-containing membrane protein [Methanobacteriota archaeon]
MDERSPVVQKEPGIVFDWLINIPGPTFLVYLLIFIISLTVVGGYLCYFDPTGKLDEPGITELEKYHIAALRGGVKEVIVTAAFSLWHKGLINLDKDEIERNEKNVPILDPIEKEVYDELSTPKTASSLVYSIGLGVRLEEYMESINKNLERLHLKPGKSAASRDWLILFSILTPILVIGGLKLYFGIVREKPVMFLIILLCMSAILIVVLLNPLKFQTTLGRRYLNSLKDHYNCIKDRAPTDILRYNMDPAIGMAVFGVTGLYLVASLNTFTSKFTPQTSSGGFGCGGAGCGGGGCGGGCGGCGG